MTKKVATILATTILGSVALGYILISPNDTTNYNNVHPIYTATTQPSAPPLQNTSTTQGHPTTQQNEESLQDITAQPNPVRNHTHSTISQGQGFAMAIKEDNTLWTWDTYHRPHQPHDSNEPIRGIPVQLKENVKTISAGAFHSMALTLDGHLYTWGSNQNWQLGDPTAPAGIGAVRNRPTRVLPNYSLTSVHANPWHSAAVTTDGELIMWGSSHIVTQTHDRSSRDAIPRVFATDVAQVSTTTTRTMFIDSNDTLWATGTHPNPSPLDFGVEPTYIKSNVKQVSASDNHALILLNDHSLWAFGVGTQGQLGDGNRATAYAPVHIMDNVIYTSAGTSYSTAITKDGALYTWGWNHGGQLGNGETTSRSLFLTPNRIMEGVVSVSTDNVETLALTADGDLWAWGGNSNIPQVILSNVALPAVGYNITTTPRLVPQQPLPPLVQLIPSPVQQLSPEGAHLARNFIDSFLILSGDLGFYVTDTSTRYAPSDTGWLGTPIQDLPPNQIPQFFLEMGRHDTHLGTNISDINGIRLPRDARPYRNYHHLARDYQAFDLMGNGIPVIIVNYGWQIGVIYMYVDGEYKEVAEIDTWQRFFIDDQGNIIMLISENEKDGTNMTPGFYALTFTETGIDIQPLQLREQERWDEWWNFMMEPYFTQSPSIFDTGTPLAEFEPLSLR